MSDDAQLECPECGGNMRALYADPGKTPFVYACVDWDCTGSFSLEGAQAQGKLVIAQPPKCCMCRKPMVEDEKDARIMELEGRLHHIDVSLQQYLAGLVTVAEVAGIIRQQREDIAGENHVG